MENVTITPKSGTKQAEVLQKHGYTKVVVEYRLSKFEGQAPYFSVTCEAFERFKCVACGCMHELISELTDEFDDMIALHLSTIDGVPMHALENGFYYLQKPDEFSDDVVMRHFRISRDELAKLRDMTKEGLATWIDAQRPRWVAEARAAIQKHDLEH